MTNALQLFSARGARFVDERGALTPEATRAFNELLTRVGGVSSVTINELAITDDDDSGLEEFKHENTKNIEAVAMRPPVSFEHPDVQQLQTELAGLREEVASLRTQINDLQQDSTYGRNS